MVRFEVIRGEKRLYGERRRLYEEIRGYNRREGFIGGEKRVIAPGD